MMIIQKMNYFNNTIPVSDEREDLDLKVEGIIPKDINGYFYRNGPNMVIYI